MEGSAFLGICLLVAASSVDAFAAGLSCGAEKIRIPAGSLLVISLICSGTLGISLLLGTLLAPIIPSGVARMAGASLLLLLGVGKLFDRFLKKQIRKGIQTKEIHFRLFRLRFILTVYANPAEADADASNRLSFGEAIALAAALSADGLAAGFGAGLTQTAAGETFLLAFVVSLLTVWAGNWAGARFLARKNIDGALISAGILLLLGCLKIAGI